MNKHLCEGINRHEQEAYLFTETKAMIHEHLPQLLYLVLI